MKLGISLKTYLSYNSKMVFQKGHKGFRPKKTEEEKELDKEARRKKFLEEHPNFDATRKQVALPDVVVTPVNAAEVLVGAINNVITLYNKISDSIDDRDIQKMPLKDKINALQKLSYIHTATKKFQPKMQFIKIDTTKASANDLEAALLNFNKVDESEN